MVQVLRFQRLAVACVFLLHAHVHASVHFRMKALTHAHTHEYLYF